MKVQLHTNCGDIILMLDADKAPETVDNFVSYVKSGHYNGTIFHRVIDDFMIQGGGLDEAMNEKPTGASIRNEANNGLNNLYGTVAMARKPDPHSACAQFFINTSDNGFLDFREESGDGWGYCVFGKVIEGMETVEKIEASPTTSRNRYHDVPEQAIVITAVEIIEE